MNTLIPFNDIQVLRTRIYTVTITILFLFFCACDSNEGVDDEDPVSNSTEFEIDVSGSFSRDMMGTNATYKFIEMPSSFVTSHQLAIYLTDSEGYTVTATILLNGAFVPDKGKYNVTDWSSGFGLQEFDGGLIFGQNGVTSHNTIGSSIGTISIEQTIEGFIKGTLAGALLATENSAGSITINGSFNAEYVP
ncbi:MAG: hypothetical protein AAF348_11765 [Bacteroidota bacterium]